MIKLNIIDLKNPIDPYAHFLIRLKCVGIFIPVLKPADPTASLTNACYSLHTPNNQCVNQHFPKLPFALSSLLQVVNHQR